MRFGSGSAEFDNSDVEWKLDTLEGVLDVATSVLMDYGPDQRNTRIERMARWLVGYLGDVVDVSGWFDIQSRPDVVSIRARGDIGVGQFPPSYVRALAIALLKAAEQAES